MTRPPGDRPWLIALRWQQFEGEVRTNGLRIFAIGTFYLIHLGRYFGSQGKLPGGELLQLGEAGEVDRRFHLLVTLLALAWVLVAATVHMSLRARYFPEWLPLASTAADLLLLTSVLCISNGPSSPMVVGYFLVMALASLRLDLRSVRLATIGSVVGYICLLGCAKWPASFGLSEEGQRSVPRYEQLVMIAALALTGIVLGQVVRRIWRLAEEYAERAAGSNGKKQ